MGGLTVWTYRGALLCVLCVLCAACGSSSPTAPAPPTPLPTPTPTPTPPPPPIAVIQVLACPDATVGVELGFYRQIGCNAFDLPLQPVRRWTIAPSLYVKTIDEAGAAIDQVTLDTVVSAMSETASAWTGGKFGLASIARGTASREGVSGWITVKWPTITDPTAACGRSQVAVDGGWVELNYKVGGGCACGASAIRPRTARHELGHALGYWHTDNAADVMTVLPVQGCDQFLSARELQAAAYQYR